MDDTAVLPYGSKFLTCPICNTRAIITITHQPSDIGDHLHIFVRCPNCERRLRGKFEYDYEFVDKWNYGETEGYGGVQRGKD